MSDAASPLQRFSERLEAFVFAPLPTADDPHRPALEAACAERPVLPPDAVADDGTETANRLMDFLAERETIVRRALHQHHEQRRKQLAVENLQATHSFRILFARTHLLDALLRFAYEVTLEEFPVLLRLRAIEYAKELAYKQEQLPRRREKLAQLEQQLSVTAGVGAVGNLPPEQEYYVTVANALREDIAADQADIAALETALPELHAHVFDPDEVRRRVVQFARGGYGRAEMSFASDVDTGYCLDTRGLGPGEIAVYREFVVRIESLLQAAGIHTAHQYFELEEDLSRFAEPETLHTIPSVLEGRALVGEHALLEALKDRFRALLPYERFVQHKVGEFEAQGRPGLTAMNLKEDRGGLRSVQVPLWLVGATYRATSFHTVDLLQLARQQGLLSLWEVSRLLRALEFLNELRNFVAAAEECYYNREARESGFYVQRFETDRIDDAMARLYLFRKSRFATMDAFDSYRLRLVQEVQQVAVLLLERVLNRTVSHTLGDFTVSVHLGHREVTAISTPGNGGPADLRSVFRDSAALLTLFGYIARTGYDLSLALKDALVDVVLAVHPPEAPDPLAAQAAQFSELMGAPYAHRALAAMFAVNDPLAPTTETLIGRWLPLYNQAFFLLRTVHNRSVPLHEHLVRSVACGQEALDALRQRYPELHALLTPEDVLALKWSLFLHGIGRIGGGPEQPAETAERASEVLGTLGYAELELERQIRLLLEHCHTLTLLGRTETYMDQALARYFEIAERRIDNAVLLYLVNQAILEAQEDTEGDLALLHRLFDEANQMLAEMRGFPRQERSLELINVYFDQKKKDLMTETRLYLLVQRIVAQGPEAALLRPLEPESAQAYERLEAHRQEVERLHGELVLGGHGAEAQERLEDKFVQLLRNVLSEQAVEVLTREEEALFSFFFNAYPNRYLMASLPRHLSAEMALFRNFRRAQVIADVLSRDQLGTEGVLIYTRNLPRAHIRVAYAMSRYGVNIISGKVNRVELGEGEHSYCYYFQTTPMEPGERFTPRDLELSIANESPPELSLPKSTRAFPARGVRVEYQGNDHKAYRIVPEAHRFRREAAELLHVRLVLRDQPFLFYKVARAFELYDAEIRQALITTTGNQVVDYFYLEPEDYERLQASNFEEAFINLVNTDLRALTRQGRS